MRMLGTSELHLVARTSSNDEFCSIILNLTVLNFENYLVSVVDEDAS